MVRDTDIKGYMDFGSVDITLLDVNDNKPTFITVRKVVYFKKLFTFPVFELLVFFGIGIFSYL